MVVDDDKVIDGIAPRDLEAALKGRTIQEACRKGKQLWLDLGKDSPALMLHFGAPRACHSTNVTPAVLCIRHSRRMSPCRVPHCFTNAGMTGCLILKGIDAVKYVNAKQVDPDIWPPKCAFSSLPPCMPISFIGSE